MGFLELKEMNLPSIPWKQYTGTEELSADFLWTIRSAVYRGEDLNLPRSVGKDSEESKKFANSLLKHMENKGMVIYYPYFIAEKSGTLEVRRDSIIIEAVKDDLWNLVTYSDCEVTLVINSDSEMIYHGNRDFLKETEVKKLLTHVPEIKKIFRDDLLEGKAALLEWSYAFSCNSNKEPINDEYLVFYEARTV